MAKRAAKKKKRSGASRRAGLSGVSTTELARELRRRERQLDKLTAKRDALLAQAHEIDAEIDSLGALIGGSARSAGGVRRRPRNEQTLTEALSGVLSGVTMSVTDAAEAVQAAGYRTSAENFRTIVNQTLLREDGVFKKVSRGQYTAKK